MTTIIPIFGGDIFINTWRRIENGAKHMGVVHLVVRLSTEDNELLETMAKHFGTSKADIIRWALKEFAKNHGFLK